MRYQTSPLRLFAARLDHSQLVNGLSYRRTIIQDEDPRHRLPHEYPCVCKVWHRRLIMSQQDAVVRSGPFQDGRVARPL